MPDTVFNLGMNPKRSLHILVPHRDGPDGVATHEQTTRNRCDDTVRDPEIAVGSQSLCCGPVSLVQAQERMSLTCEIHGARCDRVQREDYSIAIRKFMSVNLGCQAELFGLAS
jgi:hypothetical protein